MCSFPDAIQKDIKTKMVNIGKKTGMAPEVFHSQMQKDVYALLDSVGIAFERVPTSEAVTMDDCVTIGERLGTPVVKTLFLTNRQKTQFYLLVLPGGKPFSTRAFSQALGVARVSFATPEMLMDMLGCPVGGTSVLSVVADAEHRVQVVIDSEVAGEEWIALNDGTTVNYMRVKTEDVLRKYLPQTGHIAQTAVLNEKT